jgi:UDP-N-acetylglucosamine 2-epimerase
MKLLHIVGNRPHFVKLAFFLRAAEGHVESVVVHSGQHYDYQMSECFIRDLRLPLPAYNLAVGSGTHGVQTGLILSKLDPIILAERPDAVIVYGDTNTTLAGALAACKMDVPLAHVEAGLREFTSRPEEVNRKLVDCCSQLLFCPTPRAAEMLRKEGVAEERIFLTGDVTYDAFLAAVEAVNTGATRAAAGESYAIVTLHRAETVDDRDTLTEIVNTLLLLDQRVLFPVHPRTEKMLAQFGLLQLLEGSSRIKLLPPQGYYDFLRLLLDSGLVITDSGGVIKEAFYTRKPCVTLDFTNEYPEIYESGLNVLAGKTRSSILSAVAAVREVDPSSVVPSLIFGDGRAASRMVDALVSADVRARM